ncbi:hypothetical protein [Paracoccus tegillarcae]|uniref:Uncharacterized protein n=1 Tax=Paracoccus tegillarcae TaxID=1529068 RepID=A0A2K9ET16_9RHOB|nr:hypothetical protein [Paracoccus tegillarcae]AUH34885.1 hypothetical protein CUV01_17220 [Paracoccus tegillarcae]
MANTLKSPQKTEFTAPSADEAVDQMFGYYSPDGQKGPRAANTNRAQVISELDAAGAILAAKRFG